MMSNDLGVETEIGLTTLIEPGYSLSSYKLRLRMEPSTTDVVRGYWGFVHFKSTCLINILLSIYPN